MYCLGYDDIYPIFETITLKVFNAQNILHRKELISGVFDRVLVTSYFNGISKFNEYGYYTMGGRSKKGKLTDTVWLQLREKISDCELKALGLHITQDDQFNFKNDDISFTFGRNAIPEEPGMNGLQVLVSEESYRRNRSFLFCDFFVELCELAEACYGFANIHVDSSDSQAMNECYKNTIDLLPVDCINSSRYISDSDRLIKDVCWLNFINNRHLEQLPLDTKVFLSEMPFYRKNDRGVYFAVADAPHMREESYERIRKLREIFQPIICEENWYKFV